MEKDHDAGIHGIDHLLPEDRKGTVPLLLSVQPELSITKRNAGSPTGFLHGMTICILPDILPDLTARRVKEFV